jgi:tRNA splicing endonuclease
MAYHIASKSVNHVDFGRVLEWRKEGDKYCIETIAQKDYEELEQELREISLRDDSPVLQIGDVWKAKSPIELLYNSLANRKSARTFLLGCKTNAA